MQSALGAGPSGAGAGAAEDTVGEGLEWACHGLGLDAPQLLLPAQPHPSPALPRVQRPSQLPQRELPLSEPPQPRPRPQSGSVSQLRQADARPARRWSAGHVGRGQAGQAGSARLFRRTESASRCGRPWARSAAAAGEESGEVWTRTRSGAQGSRSRSRSPSTERARGRSKMGSAQPTEPKSERLRPGGRSRRSLPPKNGGSRGAVAPPEADSTQAVADGNIAAPEAPKGPNEPEEYSVDGVAGGSGGTAVCSGERPPTGYVCRLRGYIQDSAAAGLCMGSACVSSAETRAGAACSPRVATVSSTTAAPDKGLCRPGREDAVPDVGDPYPLPSPDRTRHPKGNRRPSLSPTSDCDHTLDVGPTTQPTAVAGDPTAPGSAPTAHEAAPRVHTAPLDVPPTAHPTANPPDLHPDPNPAPGVACGTSRTPQRPSPDLLPNPSPTLSAGSEPRSGCSPRRAPHGASPDRTCTPVRQTDTAGSHRSDGPLDNSVHQQPPAHRSPLLCPEQQPQPPPFPPQPPPSQSPFYDPPSAEVPEGEVLDETDLCDGVQELDRRTAERAVAARGRPLGLADCGFESPIVPESMGLAEPCRFALPDLDLTAAGADVAPGLKGCVLADAVAHAAGPQRDGGDEGDRGGCPSPGAEALRVSASAIATAGPSLPKLRVLIYDDVGGRSHNEKTGKICGSVHILQCIAEHMQCQVSLSCTRAGTRARLMTMKDAVSDWGYLPPSLTDEVADNTHPRMAFWSSHVGWTT